MLRAQPSLGCRPALQMNQTLPSIQTPAHSSFGRTQNGGENPIRLSEIHELKMSGISWETQFLTGFIKAGLLIPLLFHPETPSIQKSPHPR